MWNREFVGDFNDGVNRFKAGENVNEEDFEAKYTYGLVKWWNLELKNRTPEWAAELTGLPAEQIRRVAIGFGKAAPRAISWVGGGPAMQVRGGYSAMAAHALNGLVGSVDDVGGPLQMNKHPMSSFPGYDDFIDDVAKAGKKYSKIDHRGRKEFPSMKKGKPGSAVVTNQAADGIINEDPYDVKMILGYFNNFTFSCPQSERWTRALSKVPMIVHVTTNASEFTWFADVVLPSGHHMYEKWALCPAMANGYAHISINQPVIKPLWEGRADETEIPFLIAKRLEEKGFPNLMECYRQFKDPETGKVPENEHEFALNAIKIRTQVLWDPAKYEHGDRINGWDDLQQRGVWNSGPYPFRARWGKFKTKTHQFEFYSETLKDALSEHAEKHSAGIDEILEVCQYQARGELAFIPHYEEPKTWGEEKDYPFLFVDYKSRLNREGRSANCTWYQSHKDLDLGDEKWQDVAKLNPIDGERFGIKTGDRIRITSPTGQLSCNAKLWEGVRPGTVAKCYGQGHWAYGRVAAEKFGKTPRGGNNNEIIPADYDRLSGATAYYGVTRVRVDKV